MKSLKFMSLYVSASLLIVFGIAASADGDDASIIRAHQSADQARSVKGPVFRYAVADASQAAPAIKTVGRYGYARGFYRPWYSRPYYGSYAYRYNLYRPWYSTPYYGGYAYNYNLYRPWSSYGYAPRYASYNYRPWASSYYGGSFYSSYYRPYYAGYGYQTPHWASYGLPCDLYDFSDLSYADVELQPYAEGYGGCYYW